MLIESFDKCQTFRVIASETFSIGFKIVAIKHFVYKLGFTLSKPFVGFWFYDKSFVGSGNSHKLNQFHDINMVAKFFFYYKFVSISYHSLKKLVSTCKYALSCYISLWIQISSTS